MLFWWSATDTSCQEPYKFLDLEMHWHPTHPYTMGSLGNSKSWFIFPSGYANNIALYLRNAEDKQLQLQLRWCLKDAKCTHNSCLRLRWTNRRCCKALGSIPLGSHIWKQMENICPSLSASFSLQKCVSGSEILGFYLVAQVSLDPIHWKSKTKKQS